MFPMSHDATQRAGLLTMAAFLHGHAGPVQPSPVKRGSFVMSRFLCTPPAAPPDDVPPLGESDEGELITNRDRFAAHTQNPACQSCHLAMDSIGFTFEGYDSLGAVRTLDAGQPVDTSGALFGTDRDGPLVNAVELAGELAQSRVVHDCHVRQWFRHAVWAHGKAPRTMCCSGSCRRAFGMHRATCRRSCSRSLPRTRFVVEGAVIDRRRFLKALGLGGSSLWLPSLGCDAPRDVSSPQRLLVFLHAARDRLRSVEDAPAGFFHRRALDLVDG